MYRNNFSVTQYLQIIKYSTIHMVSHPKTVRYPSQHSCDVAPDESITVGGGHFFLPQDKLHTHQNATKYT